MISTNWDEINQSANKLTAAALEEWNRVAPVLHRRELLTVLDVGSLSRYCKQHSETLEFESALREARENNDIAKVELLSRLVEEARAGLVRCCDAFLTPADANGRMDLSENLASFEKVRLEKRPHSRSKSEVDESNQIVRSLVPLPEGVELEEIELAEWNRLAPSLNANRHLENAGRLMALVAYCQSVVYMADLENQLRNFIANGGDATGPIAESFALSMKVMRDQIETSCELLRVDLIRVKLDENWRIILN